MVTFRGHFLSAPPQTASGFLPVTIPAPRVSLKSNAFDRQESAFAVSSPPIAKKIVTAHKKTCHMASRLKDLVFAQATSPDAARLAPDCRAVSVN